MKKQNTNKIVQNIPKEPVIKYVKAAKMWGRFSWKDGKQKSEWFSSDPRK